MWAGGELVWDKKNRLCVGQEVTETTRLFSADAKVTRVGEEMMVVGVQKTFRNQNGLALVDKRDWVFRKELLEPQPVQSPESRRDGPLPEPESPQVIARGFL